MELIMNNSYELYIFLTLALIYSNKEKNYQILTRIMNLIYIFLNSYPGELERINLP